MFKLTTERLAWINVEWDGLDYDGTAVTNSIEALVELVDKTEFARLFDVEGDRDHETVGRLIRDWKGVGDESGHPLKFGKEALARLVEVPNFASGFGNSYARAWMGQGKVREGNSSGSPKPTPARDDPKKSTSNRKPRN